MALSSILEQVPLGTKTLLDFSGNERTGMQGVEHAHICCFHRDHQSHAAPLSKEQAGKGEAGNGHHTILSRPATVDSRFRIAKDKTTS